MTTTIGVEEEFHVIDPGTRRTSAGARRLLSAVTPPDGIDAGQFASEIHETMVETATTVCTDVAALEAQIRGLRAALVDAAAGEGLALAAAGSLPWRAEGTLTTSDDRYVAIKALHGGIVDGMSTCGTHVHVGVEDRELAVLVMNRVRRWVPTLLALSASSPYWNGQDTSYASYRTIVWGRWPTAHLPETFADAAQHDAVVEALVGSGAILDRKQIYWDVRLSDTYPTLEFRVADASTTVEGTLLQAALSRALVETSIRDVEAGRPEPTYRPELLRAAKWRAARFGTSGELLDLDSGRPVPAAEEVDALLQAVGGALADAGDAEVVEALARRAVEEGTSAERQREAFSRHGHLEAVIDAVAAAT